jgi:hypothetical protein
MTDDRYREALEDLDRLHAAGQVTQAQYDLHKSKLLAEASKPRLSKPVLALIIVTAMILGWILIALLSRVITTV